MHLPGTGTEPACPSSHQCCVCISSTRENCSLFAEIGFELGLYKCSESIREFPETWGFLKVCVQVLTLLCSYICNDCGNLFQFDIGLLTCDAS